MDWETLIQLDRELLLALNGSESLYLDTLARTLTATVTWVPLYVSLFFLVLKNNESFVKIMLILLFVLTGRFSPNTLLILLISLP